MRDSKVLPNLVADSELLCTLPHPALLPDPGAAGLVKPAHPQWDAPSLNSIGPKPRPAALARYSDVLMSEGVRWILFTDLSASQFQKEWQADQY